MQMSLPVNHALDLLCSCARVYIHDQKIVALHFGLGFIRLAKGYASLRDLLASLRGGLLVLGYFSHQL